MRSFRFSGFPLFFSSALVFAPHLLPAASSNTWSPAASLSQARGGSTAVRLSDGRILFIGGTGASGPLGSTEIFNMDGSISDGPSMQQARNGHAAALLHDGRVLVAGGTVADGTATNSVEIYDPASNTWTSVPNGMNTARSGETATLLNDGRVLVAGGQSTSGPTNTLEIYSPASNSFMLVSGGLSSPRQQHAAALLQDGRVLIAGGSDGSKSLASADIYDPSSDVTASAGSMSVARAGLSATTLLDGTVLLAGGSDGTKDLASGDLYNPAAAGFSQTSGALNVPRSGHVAFLLPDNNQVLIAGGTAAGKTLQSVELFSPWTGAFAFTAPMSTPRSSAVANALQQDGQLLVGAGANGTGPLSSTEVYNFATVKTDKSDYPPGTIVNISGSGWQPGETVSLTLLESPLYDTHGPYTAVADSDGNISNSSFMTDSDDANIRFYLTASGASSRLQAQNTFTDGNATSVSGKVVDSFNNPISGATVTCTSGCNNTPSVSATSSADGSYIFSGSSNKLSFNTNGPVSLTLSASKSGYTSESITITNVSNGATLTGEDITLPIARSPTSLSIAAATGIYEGTATLSATLASGNSGVSGKIISFTLNGAAVGAGTTNSSGMATLSNVNVAGLATGTYNTAVVASFAGDSSFQSSSNTGRLTITPAALTITAKSLSKNYGQTLMFAGTEFTTTGTLYNGDAITSVTLSSAGAGAAAVAGAPYTITPSAAIGSGLANYAITYSNGTLTVNAAPLTITAKSTAKTYGQVVAFTGAEFIATGLVNGDSVTSVSLASVGAVATAPVAAYSIIPSAAAGSGLSNYMVSYANGVLTVNPAPLAITVTDASMNFGGPAPAYSASYAGFVNGDTSAVLSPRPSFAISKGSAPVGDVTTAAAGTYTITPGGAAATNYSITYVSGTLTINKATFTGTVTITPGDPNTVAYGGEATATAYLNAYSIGGVPLLQSHPDPTNPNVIMPPTMTIYLVPAGGGPGQAIKFGQATAVPTFDNTTNTSGTKQTGWIASATQSVPLPGNYNAFVYGDDPGDNSLTSTNLAESGYFYTDTVDIAYPTLTSNQLDVTKANLTITANDQTKTYAQTATFAGTEFSVSGLVKGDTVTSVTLTSAGAAATATVNGSPYAITPSAAVGSGLSNYNIAYANGTLTVKPAPLMITAKNAIKTYGQTLTFGGAEVTANGLLNSDTVTSVVLSSAGAAATAGVADSPYTITPSAAVGNGLSNYIITYASGTLTVNPAPLMITATDASMSFGGSAPAYSASYSGFVNGETNTVLSPGPSFAVYKGSTPIEDVTTAAAGTYTITPSGAGSSNYSIKYVAGALTIDKATLTGTVTVTPVDPSTVSYGQPVTATVNLNSYSFGGVPVLQKHADPNNPNQQLAESVTVYLAPVNGAPSQAIKFGMATAVPTYDNTSNTTGARQTGWTATITGNAPIPGNYIAVVYGDDPGDKSLTNLNLADVGYFYADTADISYPVLQSRQIDVIPANLTITARDQTKTYGQMVTFAGTEFSVAGLVNNDKVMSVTLTSAGAAATATFTSPGPTYAIVPSAAQGTGLNNYNIKYVNGALSVNQAPLTIAALPEAKAYGTTFVFAGTEFTVSGLQNSDTVSSVTLASAGMSAGAAAGNYPIGVSAAAGTGLGNYTIAYIGNTLTVALPLISKLTLSPYNVPNDNKSTSTLSATIGDANNTVNIARAEYSTDGGSTWTAFRYSGAPSATWNVSAVFGPFASTEVLNICVRGTDSVGIASGNTTYCTLLAVYDPTGGFVTGGGWITSPVGASALYPNATGKANFGFNSQYKKGATTPTGDTQFQFQAGNLNFHANVYQWMVVSGSNVQYKGSNGTINGSGNYDFMLTACDASVSGKCNAGTVDTFRIKIMDASNGEAVVYDNMMGQADTGSTGSPTTPTTAIGGGDIVIHKGN